MQAPGPEYKFHNQLGAVIAWLIGRVRAPASLLMASSHDIDDLSPSLRVLSRLCNAAASTNQVCVQPANTQMEPTRPTVCGIMRPRRAAHSPR